MWEDARPLSERPERYDFHAHSFLTDGQLSPTDMWREADRRLHRALALTDHVALEDPKPLLDRLHAEARAWEGSPMTTLVGVEVTMVPPRRIADVAKTARRAGAEIVIVHGESVVEPVAPGTNLAALDAAEVDLLAHPGRLTEKEAELARANDKVLELSARRGHALTNGLVALRAVAAGAALVVDSDAHHADQLVAFELARAIAEGAGVAAPRVQDVLSDAPKRLLARCGKR
ncbi:MAG TPA: histidinol phosphate phosphatase domain-containing protein [Thermoplasmata archaeon]|nr:histidinol phosphate phosphatase domain-containing protein [Thermoplasmata archaeon]